MTPDPSASEALRHLRLVVAEVIREEGRWLEWWARGGKGSFAWKREAVRDAKDYLDQLEGDER